MNTIKLFTAATITAVSISGFSMSAQAGNTYCFEINETFSTQSVMDVLNAEVGLPGSSSTSDSNKELRIDKFFFDKLGSAQLDGDQNLGKQNCDVKFGARTTIFNTKKNEVVAVKDPTFVYKYDSVRSSQYELCYRFKSQTLQKKTAAKKIIPASFCVPKQ